MKKLYVLLFTLLAAMTLGSCADIAREMDIDGATDVELRQGPAGTQNDPYVLDPFKRYDLVMSANECRYFTMKVPQDWYWKVYLTGACRKENAEGRVTAVIFQVDPPWATLPGASFEKTMILRQTGLQALLAVGNGGPARPALLRICQEGAVANVTIESQVSSTSSLLGPDGAAKHHPKSFLDEN